MLLHFSVTFAALKTMPDHHHYMRRCVQLAALGEGNVAPNPMVGSVLVYEDRIIGEGYHQRYGQAHAEVNCLNSVAESDQHLVPDSVLYVSLEPCAHFGKTPPCADLVIASQIKKVVVGCRDPFEQVDGKGIEKLQQAGVEVGMNVLEAECKSLNKRFFTFHESKRPYITLKWAETADGKIGTAGKRLLISNDFSNRLVHKLRSQNMGILVGANTVLSDDPALDVRLVPGNSPIKLVIDLDNRLPKQAKVFTSGNKTIVFTNDVQASSSNVEYIQIEQSKNVLQQVMDHCFHRQLQSILVEGGAITLQHFIDARLWDEAVVIRNTTMTAGEGIAAPVLVNAELVSTQSLKNDLVTFYQNRVTH
jgi:diaminohydroxyphosphoribosylaminopyrimidine deaminase/5-amino-6-(5-phosphoribosylamino)uracil reductase